MSQPSKLIKRVRFSPPAPNLLDADCMFLSSSSLCEHARLVLVGGIRLNERRAIDELFRRSPTRISMVE